MQRTLILTLLVLFASTSAQAFDPDYGALEDQTLFTRYPEGVEMSRESAEQALRDIKIARRQLNELGDYSERRCVENIFVNSCVDQVTKARLRQTHNLQLLETRARTVVREDDTRREAQRQSERDAKYSTAPKPFKPKNSQAATQSEKMNKAEENRSQIKDRTQRAAEREAKAKERESQAEHNLKKQRERELERAKKAKAREEARAKRAAENAQKRQKTAQEQSRRDAKQPTKP